LKVSAAVITLVIADIKSVWIGWKGDYAVIVSMKDDRGELFNVMILIL